ncbi:Selenoprotein U [Aphelenchoides fujianensis]|nr:Selenoprotein U [Aphelenchoides fujianensis]
MPLNLLAIGGAAFAGAAIYANLPTRLTIGAAVPTAAYLAQGKLLPIEKGADVQSAKPVLAGELFAKSPVLLYAIRRPGCMFCRRQVPPCFPNPIHSFDCSEAEQLSSLKGKLDSKGVRLVGVVHETLGVEEFKPYLKGDVFFDPEKHFYGPKQRWMPFWLGFLRVSTYVNAYETKRAGVKGNTEGEGRLLGGVYLVKDNELKFAHLEREWGDAADPKEVEKAIDSL